MTNDKEHLAPFLGGLFLIGFIVWACLYVKGCTDNEVKEMKKVIAERTPVETCELKCASGFWDTKIDYDCVDKCLSYRRPNDK